jgi:hypothetical protein
MVSILVRCTKTRPWIEITANIISSRRPALADLLNRAGTLQKLRPMPSTTVADRRLVAEILVCGSGSVARGIGVVFAIETRATDGQRRATGARASA